MKLSFAEELLWQADSDNSTVQPFIECSRYLSTIVRVEGPLNQEALKTSLDKIVQRHEVLRSRFVVQKGDPVRLIQSSSSPSFTVIDQQSVLKDNPNEIVENIIKPLLQHRFDLACGPLLRTILVVLAGHEHILAIAAHHIVFDRWSKRLLELELKHFYDAYVTNMKAEVRPLPAQYYDYALWQRQHLNSKRSQKLSEYWTNKLSGLPDLTLPYDGSYGQVQSTRSGSSWFTIPAEDVSRLIHLSRQFRTTLATTLLAIFKLFLYKLCGVDDIAVGVPLSDRRDPKVEHLIGLFMNVVVVRTSIANRMTFLDFLDCVRRGLVDACLHQDLPYGYLLQIVPSRPLYRVVFNFMPNLPTSDLQLVDTRAESLQLPTEPQPLADLSLHIGSERGLLLCRLLYKADLFSIDCGRTFAMQIQLLIKAVLRTPQNCVENFRLA